MEFREQREAGLSEEPVGKLVHDFLDESKRVLSEGTRLIRSEVEAAKDEVRREVKKLGPAAAVGAGGGVLLHVAALMLALAIGGLLSLAIPIWVAFLVTGVAIGVAGIGMISVARKRFAAVQLKPAYTIHRLKEDQRWTKELTQSARLNLRHGT